MRKTKEILRLRWGLGLGVRQVGRSLSISHSTVVDALRRADAAGLKWPLPEGLDDAELEARLYPGNKEYPAGRSEPDWKQIHEELRDDKVTLRLLWTEYKRDHPDGYQYSGFCRRYREWRGKLDPVLRGIFDTSSRIHPGSAWGCFNCARRHAQLCHYPQLFRSPLREAEAHAEHGISSHARVPTPTSPRTPGDPPRSRSW